MAATARRRIDQLTDRNSFEEFPSPRPRAFITGTGRVKGQKVFISATDPDPGEPVDMLASLQKQIRLLEAALKEKRPLILLLDAPGHGHTRKGKTPLPRHSDRLLADREGVGRQYCVQAKLRGLAPQIGILFGRTGAATSFPLSLCDVAVMVKGSGVCIGRPDSVQQMIGERTDFDTLAGAAMHCSVSGVGDLLAETEEDAIRWTRTCLSYFQSGKHGISASHQEVPPPRGSLTERIPTDPGVPFDIRTIIAPHVDAGTLTEIKSLYAPELTTTLAKVRGCPVGIIANNSKYRGGALFPESCGKMIQFISLCDTYGIPLVFFVDTPGFMVGTAVEHAGIVKTGADVFAAISRAKVPKLCVIVRKAHSAGLYAMAGPGFDPQAVLALPTARISVFGRRALERLAAQRKVDDRSRGALAEMLDLTDHPQKYVDRGLIDRIVAAEDLRAHIIGFLQANLAGDRVVDPPEVLSA